MGVEVWINQPSWPYICTLNCLELRYISQGTDILKLDLSCSWHGIVKRKKCITAFKMSTSPICKITCLGGRTSGFFVLWKERNVLTCPLELRLLIMLKSRVTFHLLLGAIVLDLCTFTLEMLQMLRSPEFTANWNIPAKRAYQIIMFCSCQCCTNFPFKWRIQSSKSTVIYLILENLGLGL